MTAKPWALITGASSGIGAALAAEFAKDGWNLVLAARSIAPLTALSGRLEKAGAQTKTVTVDLGARDGPNALFAATEGEGLAISALVNNAGFGAVDPFLDLSLDEQLGMIDLNIRAVTELAYRFGAAMRARGAGGLLNVASTAAFQPGPRMAVYYASKSYVLSLTEALNYEWRGSGLYATALCPGPVATGFQARADMGNVNLLKMTPVMSAEDCASTAYAGFKARKPVIIPGLLNAIMAKSTGLTPRAVLLPLVERLQSRSGAH